MTLRISIHILHTKDDRNRRNGSTNHRNFNPHPSYEGWPSYKSAAYTKYWFQSTSFIRRMTLLSAWSDTKMIISIHILHTKDDLGAGRLRRLFEDFNPHPSYEGWRVLLWIHIPKLHFNPHPSYEGWQTFAILKLKHLYFNPHPSYEGWRVSPILPLHQWNFNPHPSYEGWQKFFSPL